MCANELLKKIFKGTGGLLLLLCLPSISFSSENEALQSCMQKTLLSASDSMTVGEIRATCQKKLEIESTDESAKQEEGIVAQRIQIDRENILKPFTIMAHRQNYILAAAHNFQGYSPDEYYEARGRSDFEIDSTEVQFQISIKTPLALKLFDTDIDLFAAYTVRSFWQLYNSDVSSPFRETNHEPEFWIQTESDLEIFGFKNVGNILGIVHQSNGQAGNLSRSWNRIYAEFIFHRGNFAFGIKPWIRIKEDIDNDDNPDITDYMGHAELTFAYKYNDHTFTLMSRNNLESGFSHGAVEVGWSFPLFDYPFLKGYMQYFSGYGESLIDYNNYVNRIGFGILLTDLL
ncbi:MAG: phospholipase [Desulfobulbaceae bacterium]|nr:MAG: phospholipase [Desulfobulbaceae bacterium]